MRLSTERILEPLWSSQVPLSDHLAMKLNATANEDVAEEEGVGQSGTTRTFAGSGVRCPRRMMLPRKLTVEFTFLYLNRELVLQQPPC